MTKISKEERNQVWEVLAPNLTDSSGNLLAWDEWGERATYALNHLDPELKNKVEEVLLARAWQGFTKDIAKSKASLVVSNARGKRKVSRYVGVPVIREDGTVVEQQKLVETLTLTEAQEVRKGLVDQVQALGFNIEMMEIIIAKCVSHGVNTVPEMLEAEGATIDQLFPEA